MTGRKTRVAAGVLLAGLIAAIPLLTHQRNGWTAQAQNLGQRTVSGAVVDGSSNPVSGATVFLKNEKTKAIRSYTSSKDGRFHFAQVNMAEDYDLWAEKDSHKSVVKTVSSWDARKEFETELRMK
ncbi:MAG TPA: carboxypeptidase-like regulatory domain-containing protein [Terracidiphilus sp.]|nr:carboxypeptidase-like regulatory domain-containing protein [Terracidiphilus sp.]